MDLLTIGAARHGGSGGGGGDVSSLARVARTGDYNDLKNKPTLPTKVSDLENDSDFQSYDEILDLIEGIAGDNDSELSNEDIDTLFP